jgi:hypothetical protein
VWSAPEACPSSYSRRPSRWAAAAVRRDGRVGPGGREQGASPGERAAGRRGRVAAGRGGAPPGRGRGRARDVGDGGAGDGADRAARAGAGGGAGGVPRRRARGGGARRGGGQGAAGGHARGLPDPRRRRRRLRKRDGLQLSLNFVIDSDFETTTGFYYEQLAARGWEETDRTEGTVEGLRGAETSWERGTFIRRAAPTTRTSRRQRRP